MPLDDDRLFPADPSVRSLARSLFAGIRDLPIVSPHGHTDPRWYAENERFPDPARHDVARRVDCAYLAELVLIGRLREEEAAELAGELAYGLAKRACRL